MPRARRATANSEEPRAARRTTKPVEPRATRDRHPAVASRTGPSPKLATGARLEIPSDLDDVTIAIGEREVKLTNLGKVFWPELGLTKRDLLQYYADVSGALLPHLHDRAMVMKRYPNGAAGDFFFLKRAP